MSGGSSYFESTFDYRSLLPTRATRSIEEDDGEDADSWCFEMSWRERMLGCGTCMVAGYMLSFGSFWRLSDLVVRHDPFPFVVHATVGNLMALGGSFFLMGPKAQWTKMWKESRRVATMLYLGSLFLTLMVAFFYTDIPGPGGLYLLLLMIAQYIAITWYCLSYIPFAQDMLRGFLRRRFSESGEGGM
jgi:hypothetical protein